VDWNPALHFYGDRGKTVVRLDAEGNAFWIGLAGRFRQDPALSLVKAWKGLIAGVVDALDAVAEQVAESLPDDLNVNIPVDRPRTGPEGSMESYVRTALADACEHRLLGKSQWGEYEVTTNGWALTLNLPTMLVLVVSSASCMHRTVL